jgi:hypothetical protein
MVNEHPAVPCGHELVEGVWVGEGVEEVKRGGEVE